MQLRALLFTAIVVVILVSCGVRRLESMPGEAPEMAPVEHLIPCTCEDGDTLFKRVIEEPSPPLPPALEEPVSRDAT